MPYSPTQHRPADINNRLSRGRGRSPEQLPAMSGLFVAYRTMVYRLLIVAPDGSFVLHSMRIESVTMIGRAQAGDEARGRAPVRRL